MSMAAELNSQIASIMEVLANSAVVEICKAVEDGYAVVNLEMSRSLKESECLRRRVRLLELQVSRYRAEQRLKSPLEGGTSGRAFPGVRLLHHRTGRDTPTGSGFSLQSRSRFLNRSFVSQPLNTPPIDKDQDPDQEVVTTTKTESTECEEDSDLVIVKVEGSVSVEAPNVSSNNSSALTIHTSETQAQTEVSGSQTINEIQDETVPLSRCQQTKKHDKNSDVIVIDVDGEKPLASNQKHYVEKTRHSFQAAHRSTATTVNEAAGTSSSNATSFVNNRAAPSNQRTLNLQPTNTSQVSSKGSFSGEPFAQSMRLFSCSKCPMSFALEAELVKHIAGHRGRKYICGLCGKDFVSKSKLEIHQNVHTGEKPFKCTLCNSCFSNPSNVRRHMRLQHQQ